MIMKKNIYYMISLGLIFLLINSCEKEVSTSPPTQPVPVASIMLSSEPEGADIYTDGRATGQVTPDSLPWLEEKLYSITLKKELYRDTTFKVNIKKDERKNLFIDFNANPKMRGKINCVTVPDSAKIYLNGKFTNKYTPAILDTIIPGNYRIKYVRDNARTDSMTTTVRSNRVSDAALVLVDTTYWVDYNTHTSGIFDNYYTMIAVDHNDVKWLASSAGLASFDGTTWKQYTSANSGLVDDLIHVIKVDANNHLWIGTASGLNEFDGNTWRLYDGRGPARLPSNEVFGFDFDLDGNVIVATKLGLVRSKDFGTWESFGFKVAPDSPPYGAEDWMSGVDVDELGRWWITTTTRGIIMHENSRWHYYFSRSQDNDKAIYYRGVNHTATGEIWFSHYIKLAENAVVGLSSYIGNRFNKTTYTIFNGVSVFNIAIKDGTQKWISSSEGLYVFNQYFTRTVYRMSNTPLVTNDIRGVDFDSNGDAWVVTYGGGLYHFKVSKL